MRVLNRRFVPAAILLLTVLESIPGIAETTVPQARTDTGFAKMEECETLPYSMLITVKEVRHSEGTITVDLHGDDPETFLRSGTKLDRIRVPATEGETFICIGLETPGIYAFALYHDEDADTKFDKNFIGLPAEPFGLSNDPKIRLARPKHEECAFEVTGPLTPVTATLNH